MYQYSNVIKNRICKTTKKRRQYVKCQMMKGISPLNRKGVGLASWGLTILFVVLFLSFRIEAHFSLLR